MTDQEFVQQFPDMIEGAFFSVTACMADVTIKPEDRYIHEAAKSKLREAQALMTMAAGIPFPFRKELRSMTSELNGYIAALDERNQRVIDEAEGDVEEQIGRREEAEAILNQARIMGVLTLVHLSQALDATQPLPAKLKAV